MPVARSLRVASAGSSGGGTNEYLAATRADYGSLWAWTRTAPTTFNMGTSVDAPQNVTDAAWSPDGVYLAGINYDTAQYMSPTLVMFKRVTPGAAALTQYTGVVTPADYTGRGVTFTPDGVGLLTVRATGLYSHAFTAATGAVGAGVNVYSDTTLTGSPRFSPDGQIVVVTTTVSPYLLVFTRTPGTNTYTATPTAPNWQSLRPKQPVAWHPAGQVLAVVVANAMSYGQCFLLPRSGATLGNAVYNIGGTSTRQFTNAAFSPDGTLLAVTGATTPYVWIYPVLDAASGQVGAFLDVPAGTDAYRKPIWSNDSKTLFLVPSDAGLHSYSRSGTTFTFNGAVTSGTIGHFAGNTGNTLYTALSPLTT